MDNFGVTGDRPSHAELLDHLATRFIDGGWSVKKLVRTIVLSRTYRLASTADVGQTFLSANRANDVGQTFLSATLAKNLQLDPANRLIWRHSPRRLDAEEIRDAMLMAAGRLNLSRPDGSPAKDMKVMELPNNGPLARQLEAQAAASTHRSIYLPLLRTLTPHPLAVFDFAEQGMVTGSRDTTTVATQALYLLNDPFVREQAEALAVRLLGRNDVTTDERINWAYGLTLNRAATAEEVTRAAQYIAAFDTRANEKEAPSERRRVDAWSSFCQAMLASADFRYVR